MTWPPHLTVATIVHRHDTFLMVEESPLGRRVLNQPAGHLEPGETFFDAALRETREETGWAVALRAISGIYHYTLAEAGTTYHRVTFIAEPVRHVTNSLDATIERAVWLSWDDIMGREAEHRSPIVARCLQDYASGQSYPLELLSHA